MLFCCKLRFSKVEFFWRDSAKAWQEKSGPRDFFSIKPCETQFRVVGHRSCQHLPSLYLGHTQNLTTGTSLPWQWDPYYDFGTHEFSKSSGSSSQQGTPPEPCKATQILFEKAAQNQNSEGMERFPKNAGRPRKACYKTTEALLAQPDF